MDEELKMADSAEIERNRDYRSLFAWVLMVMFIMLPPVGLGMVMHSVGWGILGMGVTSGVAGYILGSD